MPGAAMPGAAPTLATPFRLVHDPARVAEVEEVARLLRDAPIVESSRRPFPGAGDNPARIVDLIAPDRPGGVLTVVEKMPNDYAAPEAFQTRIANLVGIGPYYAQAELRADGRALLEIVPGTSLKQAGVLNSSDMLRVIERGYELRLPHMPPAERALRSKVDLELIQFTDWLTAQADRSPNNGSADVAEGVLRIRDHGKMTHGETPLRPTKPWNPYPYMGGPNERIQVIHLRPETRAVIAERLSAEDIRDAAKLFQATNEGEPKVLAAIRGWQRSDGLVERMLARRASALATGEIQSIHRGLRTSLLEAGHKLYPVFARLR